MSRETRFVYGRAGLEALKDLLKVFGEAFDDVPTYQEAVPSDDYLLSLLASADFIPLVCTVDEKVVGGLAAYVLRKFERQRSEIYIYDLAVHKDFRRRGIATGLIRTLQQSARDMGAYVIFVQADRIDEPAIKLYEGLGTREDVYHFDIFP